MSQDEGYFLWRNFILLPKKESENILSVEWGGMDKGRGTGNCVSVDWSQRTTLWTQFLPPTFMWVLGTGLRLACPVLGHLAVWVTNLLIFPSTSQMLECSVHHQDLFAD